MIVAGGNHRRAIARWLRPARDERLRLWIEAIAIKAAWDGMLIESTLSIGREPWVGKLSVRIVISSRHAAADGHHRASTALCR
jgi:hypothetical protein